MDRASLINHSRKAICTAPVAGRGAIKVLSGRGTMDLMVEE